MTLFEAIEKSAELNKGIKRPGWISFTLPMQYGRYNYEDITADDWLVEEPLWWELSEERLDFRPRDLVKFTRDIGLTPFGEALEEMGFAK